MCLFNSLCDEMRHLEQFYCMLKYGGESTYVVFDLRAEVAAFFTEHHFLLNKQLWKTNSGYSDLVIGHMFF